MQQCEFHDRIPRLLAFRQDKPRKLGYFSVFCPQMEVLRHKLLANSTLSLPQLCDEYRQAPGSWFFG
jgi:hypothetical protein